MEKRYRPPVNGPFNRRIKEEINGWLGRLDFELSEVLSEEQEELVRGYFSRGAGYESQSRLAESQGYSVGEVRSEVEECLRMLDIRDEYGEDSVVTLKLERGLQAAVLEEGVTTCNELLGLEPVVLKRIAGSPERFKQLKEVVGRKTGEDEIWVGVRFGVMPENLDDEDFTDESKGKWGGKIYWQEIVGRN